MHEQPGEQGLELRSLLSQLSALTTSQQKRDWFFMLSFSSLIFLLAKCFSSKRRVIMTPPSVLFLCWGGPPTRCRIEPLRWMLNLGIPFLMPVLWSLSCYINSGHLAPPSPLPAAMFLSEGNCGCFSLLACIRCAQSTLLVSGPSRGTA